MKDNLFKTKKIESDFKFDENVAEVFDNMLDRSIPHYREIIHLTCQIINEFSNPNAKIVDLGCSTGNTLIILSEELKSNGYTFTGVDNSNAMIDKANKKCHGYKDKNIKFIKKDITDFSLKGADVVILNYTLQFLRPIVREKLLTKIHTELNTNGLLILNEKLVFDNPIVNRKFINIYYNFKQSKGYSRLEIAKKREALENVLIPFTLEENKDLLKNAGFKTITTFFQWFNFAGFLAIKN
jgi:tRNA (cmo5U34)-methyltransferase